MVKAKELKLLRKALDQHHKSTVDPLEVLLLLQHHQQQQQQQEEEHVNSTNTEVIDTDVDTVDEVYRVIFGNVKFRIVSNKNNSESESPKLPNETTMMMMMNDLSINPSQLHPVTNMQVDNQFTVQYYRTLPNHLLEQCLQLFTMNMKEFYENSAWGYDIQTKQQELQHPHAQFIIITTTTSTSELSDDFPVQVVAFVHYRYCYDDDDDPTMLVLYIYEMQVQARYQKQGIGQYCMYLMEHIATQGNTTTMATATTTNNENKITIGNNTKTSRKSTSGNKKKSISVVVSTNHLDTSTTTATTQRIQKIMLTVFRQNTSAMQFYTSKLNYTIDATSPSQYNQITDYEILSKSI